jgi:hypothetical protein
MIEARSHRRGDVGVERPWRGHHQPIREHHGSCKPPARSQPLASGSPTQGVPETDHTAVRLGTISRRQTRPKRSGRRPTGFIRRPSLIMRP